MSANLNIPTQAGHAVRATGPPSRASLVVRASGDIDLATTPELDHILQAAVSEVQPARHLVLDLAAVTFMDCRGLSALVAARRRLGGRFWLANPPAQVLGLLPYVWGSLALEVTEEALLADLDNAIRNTRRLQQLGVVMALDDFGAGYSSLAHLAELPVDILKLDRQLIVNLDTQQGSRVIVEGLITTARRLTIDIVAEGVETRAQHDLLREMGCGYAQGFLFGGAQPAAAYGDRPWMPWTADTGPSDPGPSDPGPAGSRPARQVAETPASAG